MKNENLKVMILAVAAALLASMALIAVLDSYVTRIHAQAPREVVRLEAVTVTALPSPAWSHAAAAEPAPGAGRI